MQPIQASFGHTLRLSLVVAVLALLITAGVSSSAPPAEPPVPPYRVGGPPNPPDIPPGYTIIEGDIQVPIEWLTQGAINAIWATNLWTNGVIPYEFDANVTPDNQSVMLDAMGIWESAANVDFRPRTGDANYVHIQNSNANNSAVGMQGGKQFINIVDWVDFIMAHELGHCLGFWHEHTRSDRGGFITVNTSNIQQDFRDQFDLNPTADHYGPYDFDSLMHYDQCAFSIDCPYGWTCNCSNTVITVLPPNQAWQTLIGQRTHLSQMDSLTMSFLYPRSNWRFVDGSYTGSTENGMFLTPYKQFPTGFSATPSGGTLWVQPGTYAAVGTYNKAVTIRAPLGSVTLGQ